MQLQCIEVPRSVETCLRSSQRPKTQIHFPNPFALTPVESKLRGMRSACHNLSDSRERTVPRNLQRNPREGSVKRLGFSSEDVLHYGSEDVVNIISGSRTVQGGRCFVASEQYNHTSTPTEESLHERQRDKPVSSPNSSLDKGLVYQRITPSDCKISAASLSEVSVQPGSPLATRRSTRNRPHSQRNCWGGTSYTDLITSAIESSPIKRMTLAQIYDWIVQNVPYFKDKERYLSIQGWKNTVRHTLSIRRRFIRIKDPKRPYRSMWTVGEEKGSRRATQTRKRNNARTAGADA